MVSTTWTGSGDLAAAGAAEFLDHACSSGVRAVAGRRSCAARPSRACQARSTRRLLLDGDDACAGRRHLPRQAVERLLADALAALVDEQRVVGERAEPRQAAADDVALLVDDRTRTRCRTAACAGVASTPARAGCVAAAPARVGASSSPSRVRALSLSASSVREAASSLAACAGGRAGARSRRLRRCGSRPGSAPARCRRPAAPAPVRGCSTVLAAMIWRVASSWRCHSSDSSPWRSRVSVSTSVQAWVSRVCDELAAASGRAAPASIASVAGCLASTSFSLPRAASTWRRSATSALRAMLRRCSCSCWLAGLEDAGVAVVVLDDVVDRAAQLVVELRVDLVLAAASSRRLRRRR